MTTIETPSSDRTPTTLGRLLMLEGMPGAGKTTAATALSGKGHQVIGEYTTSTGATIPVPDHPPVGHDHAHQANWLLKHRHVTVARRSGTVFCDRDWLSALAYAASVDDGGQLLRARTRWASERLRCGDLAVADDYVLFHLDPDTSVARRRDRLTPGHPWSTRAGLRRLQRFYADPVSAVDESLGHALCAATWHHLRGSSVEHTVGYLRDLADRPWVRP